MNFAKFSKIATTPNKYLFWMAVNSWSTSYSSVISTNSMLSSVTGTSPEFSSVVTTTYIGKDIIGQLGGLGYAWKTGKTADKQPDKYITKGAVIQQVSFYLETASIFITDKAMVMPFLGVCSTMKNVSYISIGAVSANNIQKISPKNIGEFYARVASINTLASTFGMMAGVFSIHYMPNTNMYFLPVMSVISVYSLRKATNIANANTSNANTSNANTSTTA
jgi:hypothetical protein